MVKNDRSRNRGKYLFFMDKVRDYLLFNNQHDTTATFNGIDFIIKHNSRTDDIARIYNLKCETRRLRKMKTLPTVQITKRNMKEEKYYTALHKNRVLLLQGAISVKEFMALNLKAAKECKI